MKKFRFFSFILLLLVAKLSSARTIVLNPDSLQISSKGASQSETKVITGKWIMYEHKTSGQTITIDTLNLTESIADDKPTIDKLKRRKKIIATLLAFPLPCGIIGLHRVYLGTKPYVPLVYIATVGGAVGIVPFIDFIVLLLEKDISKYENNPNVIMWAN